MKFGKFFNLGHHNNVKLGYGTVNSLNLKSVYITLTSWIDPNLPEDTVGKISHKDILFLSKRKIKQRIYDLRTDFFKRESIVDIDLRLNAMKNGKKSFLHIEITLFVNNQLDLKSSDVRDVIKNLCHDIIDSDLTNKILFNFHKTKN